MNEIAKNVEQFNAPLPIGTPNMINVLERALYSKDVDIEKLERLMALQERMLAREAEQYFNAAMTAAQTGMRAIATDSSNPQTKSKYASYNALDRVLRPIYTQHGFSLSFDTGDAAENYVRVLCYVSHARGHSRTYHVDMPADGKGAKGGDVMTKTHAAGAAMSYGSRYLLKLIFNVAVGEDDRDGNHDDGGIITPDQLEHVRNLLDRTQSDPELFCKHFKIDALPNLLAKDFPRAMEMLNTKARAKK